MNRVLTHIEERAARLRDHPFLAWLTDPSLPPRERLSEWLPCAAFWVFSFMDLNAELLVYPELEAGDDPLKQAINTHLEEDAMHWPWFLHDLETLGVNRSMPFSEALRFLWGKDTRAQRLGMYRLCAAAAQASEPAVRYALISALEAGAHLLFAALVRVSTPYEQATGDTLQYLGPEHSEREPGHLTHQADATEDAFSRIVLTAEEHRRAVSIADAVFDVIDTRWREFLREAHSKKHAAHFATV